MAPAQLRPAGDEPRTTRTRGAARPPPTKKKALEKADALKAAAGVFFGTYTGYADACRKLNLGDPVLATPHIVYYTNTIKASTELQSALLAQRTLEAAQEATPTITAPAAAATPAAAMDTATATATAPPKTPVPSGGYMGCGGTFAEYQVPGTLCPTHLRPHSRPHPGGRRHRRRRRCQSALSRDTAGHPG